MRIGQFTITEYPTGGFWVEKDGEGMHVNTEELEQLLQEFHDREF